MVTYVPVLRNQRNSDSLRIRSLLKSNLYQKDLQVESCTTNGPEAVISKSNEPEAVIRNLFSNLFFLLHALNTVRLSNLNAEKIVVVLQTASADAQRCAGSTHTVSQELLARLYR